MHFIWNFLILIFVIKCNYCLTPASLDKTFEKGVKAYSEERWSKCIEKFEEALHLYKLYESVVVNCRLKCNAQLYEPQVKENIDDLKIYEAFFNKRNCINKCQEHGFAGMNINSRPEEYVLSKMHAKKPYEYLHICYFQMRMFHKAASAAYTYLMAHPNDETMKANVQYYIAQPEVDATELVDYEGDDYVMLYELGKKAYNNDNWAVTVGIMEEVIKDYLSSENKCRVECERQPGQEWSSEFVITMSNNMASLLHCRQSCQDKLKLLRYNSGIEFLTDVLNYLQISYYHLEKYPAAAEAVATFLALVPNDSDMTENEKIYSTLVDKKATAQRSEIIHYSKRDSYEKDLLIFFHQENKDNIDSNAI